MAADNTGQGGGKATKPGPTIIQVRPVDPRTGVTPPSLQEIINGKKPGDDDGKGKGSSGSGGSSAAADKLKTAKRYASASQDLQSQIAALRDSIRRQFGKNRRQNIADINLMLNQQFDLLKEGGKLRGEQFLEAASDANKATADVQEGGFRNLVRERADSMTAILEQGAGETDAMRAMLMNARNWNANASEANRAYFDTMQSINQGITDLNIDQKTALANAHMTAQGAREQEWQKFYDRRSEARTQLGNVLGERVNLLEQAKELGLDLKGGVSDKSRLAESYGVLPGKKGRKASKQLQAAREGMRTQFMAASHELGKSYVERPLPEWIEDYEAAPTVKRRQENTNLAAAPTMEGVQRAQGATLRTWA